jgi:hypothetical protein
VEALLQLPVAKKFSSVLSDAPVFSRDQAAVFVQACLALIVVHLFRFESSAFYLSVEIFLVAATLSSFFSNRIRISAIFLVSLLGLFVVLSPVVASLVCLISLAAILLARLRISTARRAFLLGALGATLLSWRYFFSSAIADAVVPAVGSVFMLRMFTYLRDDTGDTDDASGARRASLRETLAYFFLLPNFVSFFFPIVDSADFIDSARAPASSAEKLRALDLIVNGVLHLVLYRLFRTTFILAFEDVGSWGELVQFLIFNYLGYLRISGTFHLIIGIIGLFGVSLPRSHNLYLFSDGMADFLRRANTYWKNFMLRAVFYPLYFKTRKKSPRSALLISAIGVCGASLLLHTYVYVWMRGRFVLRAADILFWSLVGASLGVSLLIERRRKSSQPKPETNSAIKRALRISIFLIYISFLWAIWTLNDVRDLIGVLPLLRWRGIADLKWILFFPAVGILGAAYFEIRLLKKSRVRQFVVRNKFFNGISLIVLIVIGLPISTGSTRLSKILSETRDPDFQTEFEFETRGRDFYEGLRAPISEPKVDEDDRPIEQQKYFIALSDYRRWDWRPSSTAVFMGHRLVANQFGMLDQEVGLQKSPGIRRVAILGASNAIPYGIEQGREWPKLIAQKFQESKDQPLRNIEFLNFSVIGYNVSAYPRLFEKKVAAFSPDILLIAGSMREYYVIGLMLANALRNGLVIPYPELRRAAGVDDANSIESKHYFFDPPIEINKAVYQWGMSKIASLARTRGMRVVFCMTPSAFVRDENGRYYALKVEQEMIETAKKEGFVVLDVRSALAGRNLEEVTISDDPNHYSHYNELGHKLISESLSQQLGDYLRMNP